MTAAILESQFNHVKIMHNKSVIDLWSKLSWSDVFPINYFGNNVILSMELLERILNIQYGTLNGKIDI